MDSGQIVLLAGGILALLALVLIPLGLLLRRRRVRLGARLSADLSSEAAIHGPQDAVYRGGSGVYPRVNGNGKLLLTARRLIFRILIGTDVLVELGDITAISEARVFRRSVVAGQMHLILQTASGEIGFLTADNAAWTAALEAARSVL